MNSRQKALLVESLIVVATTAAAVVGMMHLKDYVNRSEAIRAMDQLGEIILAYRAKHGSLPPKAYVDDVKGDVEGAVRMGNVRYRALYIGRDAPDETILAYSHKRHPSSFLRDGYVVLTLDGTVRWMPTAQFIPLFETQRTPMEADVLTE